MLIFLIGMPGSGKTTLAKALGLRLNEPVWDTDDMIENNEGKNIPQLFAERGEFYFRMLEHQLIADWPHTQGIVATGGGLPCFENNISLLKNLGTTIYIEVDTETLMERLYLSSHRPLVTQTSFHDTQLYVHHTLSQRSGYYEQAHITISGQKNIQDTVEEIIKEINLYKKTHTPS